MQEDIDSQPQENRQSRLKRFFKKRGAEVAVAGAAGMALFGGLDSPAHSAMLEYPPAAMKGGPAQKGGGPQEAPRRNMFIEGEINQPYELIYKSPSGNIKIVGNDVFIEQTRAALDLLQTKSPEHFKDVTKYVGEILRVKFGSSMHPWNETPTFYASDSLFQAGTAWYAGDIVHDANHSKQYLDYLAQHPKQAVPVDVFYGEKAELECMSVQADALRQIGAPQNQIDWLINEAPKTKYWETLVSEHDY